MAGLTPQLGGGRFVTLTPPSHQPHPPPPPPPPPPPRRPPPAPPPTPPPPPHPTPHPQVRLANSEKEAESMRVGIQRVQSLEKDSEILRSQAAEYSKLLQQER